jgi:hypothetical protein
VPGRHTGEPGEEQRPPVDAADQDDAQDGPQGRVKVMNAGSDLRACLVIMLH